MFSNVRTLDTTLFPGGNWTKQTEPHSPLKTRAAQRTYIDVSNVSRESHCVFRPQITAVLWVWGNHWALQGTQESCQKQSDAPRSGGWWKTWLLLPQHQRQPSPCQSTTPCAAHNKLTRQVMLPFQERLREICSFHRPHKWRLSQDITEIS